VKSTPPGGAFRQLLMGMRPFAALRAGSDAWAGVTLAALAIPACLGYARIAGMPVVTGLYTLVVPLVAFALFGASRQLVVAADSSTAAIMGAALVAMAAQGSADYVSLAATLALFTAVLFLAARALGLGFLSDFLAQSALVGFLAGTGVHILISEVADLAGAARPHQVLLNIGDAASWLTAITFPTMTAFLLTIAALWSSARFLPRVPGALIVVAAAIAASGAFDLGAHGVATIGPFAAGLPTLTWPGVSMERVHLLGACAVSVFVVAAAKSAAVARAFADRHRERSEPDADLAGLAAANMAAAVSGAFVVSGSATKTQMVDAAGGRSQLAHVTAAAVVAVVLIFLTHWFALLPVATLSAIVFLAGLDLIDVRTLRALAQRQRDEFLIAVATAACVLTFGLIEAVAFAFVASIVDYVRRTYRPRAYALRRDGTGIWERAPAGAAAVAAPETVAAYRFEAGLFYANARGFSDAVIDLVEAHDASLEALVLDASGIDSLDFTSATMLGNLRDRLADRGVALALAAPPDALVEDLHRYAFDAGPAKLEVFGSLQAAYAHFAGARPAPA